MKRVGTIAVGLAIGLTAAASLGEAVNKKAAAKKAPAAAPAALPSTGPAPADLEIGVIEAGGRVTVSANRGGHLVALVGGGARGAGEGMAKVSMDRAAFDGAAREALAHGAALIWETSALGEVDVERGTIALAVEEGRVVARASGAAAPASAGRWKGPHHACEAHDDAAGGFAVVCVVDRAAREVNAASLTATWANDDVAIARTKNGATVRIDLPLEGLNDEVRSASAIASFHVGRSGFALAFDATELPGENKAIAMSELHRDQPVASDEIAPRGFARKR